MHCAVAYQDAARRVIQHIALRKRFQHPRERHDDQGQVAQRRGIRRPRPIQVLTQRFELGHVHFFHIREVRNIALGLAHAFGDQATQADDLDFRRFCGNVRARSRYGLPGRAGGRQIVAQYSPAGTRPDDRGQVDARFTRPAPIRRGRHHPRAAPRPATAGALSAATAAVFAAPLATAAAPSLTSNTISGEPTATFSPGAPVIDTTRPLTGAGTSTAALSVITSTISWSSVTASPGLACQATISASTVPSPKSGILNTYWLMPAP